MLAVEIRKVLLADLLARQDEQRTLVFGALTPEERAVGVNDDLVALGEQIDILPVIIGVVTAAIVGFAAIKALEWLVKIDKFKIFGYYCLVLGVVVIIAGIVEKVR